MNKLDTTSLYVHVPFCQKKCLYCSFVVSVAQQHRMDEYLHCLNQEAYSASAGKTKTIYIGGGTPSFLANAQIKDLDALIRSNFNVDDCVEKTIEANPEDITRDKAKLLMELGFTRISLGVQSFSQKYLRYLGRCHDSKRAWEAFDILKGEGFSNINVDLMFGFPDQTEGELREDLKAIEKLSSDHVSIYSLTVEENSRFYALNVKPQGNYLQAEFYKMIMCYLNGIGLKQYEISNFAKEGKESIHNMNYWMGGDYVGLGIGAHSHDTGKRWQNISRLTEYIKAINRDKSPVEYSESLTPEQQLIEQVLFGLRMNKGVDVVSIEKKLSLKLDRGRKKLIDTFIQAKFLEQDGSVVRTTQEGRLVLDELCTQLI